MKKNARVALILLCLVFSPGQLLADALPGLPEYLAFPFAGVRNHQALSSAVELELFFENAGYKLERVRKEQGLPQLYVANLPPDLNGLTVPQKTSLFTRLLLTSAVRVNSDILAVRNELNLLADKQKKGIKFSAQEQRWLVKVAADHRGDPDKLQDLLYRVDTLPVGLIMAQAIDESGWGTSRFAIAGNALYGQHLSKNSKGTFLTTPGGHVRVASFDNLYHSTAGYIHNLNTTKAYDRLRADRAEIRRKHGKLTGYHLAGALLHYSARGQHYVDTLRWLIKHYKLDELDNIQLDNRNPGTLIKFQR